MTPSKQDLNDLEDIKKGVEAPDTIFGLSLSFPVLLGNPPEDEAGFILNAIRERGFKLIKKEAGSEMKYGDLIHYANGRARGAIQFVSGRRGYTVPKSGAYTVYKIIPDFDQPPKEPKDLFS